MIKKLIAWFKSLFGGAKQKVEDKVQDLKDTADEYKSKFDSLVTAPPVSAPDVPQVVVTPQPLYSIDEPTAKEPDMKQREKVVDQAAVDANAEIWKKKYAEDKMHAVSWMLYAPKRPKTGLTGQAQQNAILKAAGTDWDKVAKEMGYPNAGELWQNTPTTMG